MDSEFTLTTDEIWRNTIRTVEAAYCWLLTYEGKDYELVDDTITAMRKLITHGKTYEGALAIAVSTEQQLDQVIRDIYAASCVAVDCEFLGQKKTLPELKLLQIGVSKEKGYAIQVDMIGPQVIADKLKPILEDQNLNIVGWAFRGDALAIESYINGIELAPVLDLQAKLLPVAMENLNLGNALNKYAAEWVGNEEFQKDKQYGNQFIFTGKECIWLRDPLPPKALVYSVFDVLSVVALYEHTLDYPSNENHYWPFTVTSTSTQKSIDKWHMQRAKGINNSNVVNVVNSKSTKVSHGKEPALSTSVITDDGYNDDDERFKRAIQVALERSVKDNLPRNKRGESSTDRVISSDSLTELNYSEISQELEENPYNRNKNDLHFSDPPPVEESTIPEIVESTWGTESLDDQPFFGSAFKNKTIKSPDDVAAANAATTATETDKVPTFSANSYKSPKPSNLSPRVPEKLLASPSASRSSTRKSPAMSDRSPQNQYASCKPDKNKYTNDLKNRINVGSQTGSFTTWSPSNKNEMSSASWKSFASTSIKDWGEGKDASLGAIQTVGKNETSPIPEPIPFNTTVQSNYPRGGNIGDSSTGKMNEMDNWAQDDERPDTMQMPMNQIPIRTTFSGPKVTNPNDDNDDDDDDDDDDAYIDHDNFDADGIFLYSEDGDAELSMYIMTKPEELDMIHMPPKDQDFTATICYHFISSNNQRIIKAIQIYLSTGDSYTAMVEKTFMMKKPGTFKHTKFAQLLTDPSIKRVCWCPSFIEEEMNQLLGFTIGPCIDLMNRANFNREHPHYFSFIGAVDYFLQDWPDKKQFDDAKADYDAIIAKKFSSTCWDREKLPDAVLTYCALQGLAAYTLYCRTVQQIDAPDSMFMYESDM
ncbi:uncharacterized protein EV154DRAFT_469667 [Mucor mucedo]|uniref:uncharacterized protein n=1 Tax=Mucor mucedo TaxID=29922 RepID=UPI0022204316|nr:uncharacterized protein EV154DRAFT_469667 [Mucor mucedo]KAI7887969.1 hypothetical protein EV154DRAFT_469667 [Mucor mucedo]